MIRRSTKIVALLLALVLAISVGGVAATWYFAGDTPSYTSDTTELTMETTEFTFDTSSLIKAIVNEMNDVDSDINTNLRARFAGNVLGWGTHSYYGSMDPNHDNEGISALLEKYGSDMSFVVKADISDYDTEKYTYTTAYIYTCDVPLGDSGTSDAGLFYTNTSAGNPTIPIGEYIYRIYQTKITRTGTTADTMSDWTIEETLLGYARSCWYCENRSASPIATQIPSYDISTWQEGNLGYSNGTQEDTNNSYNNYAIDIAVRTFDGDTPTAYNDEYDTNSDREKTYYTVTQSGSGSFYFLLETAGNTYYYRYNSGYTYAGTNYPSGLAWIGNQRQSAEYTYNATGTYTVTCDLDSATITILDASGSEITSGTSLVEFSTSGSGTKYYIKIDSGGETANLTVNRTGD